MTPEPPRDTAQTRDFYDSLPRVAAFDQLTDPACFDRVPDDWLIGVADVVNSTGEIAAGRYKTVNMVGAAVISAMMNGLDHRAFPFMFGGDGSGFAIWPDAAAQARTALAAVQAWGMREFDIGLRVALVPVADIRAAGPEVLVARYQASAGVDYAMFAGGGLSWAETAMKQGAFGVPVAAADAVPDLTGLSCRWSHMPARNGAILSLVIAPVPEAAPDAVARVLAQVIGLVRQLERGGHPAPEDGPGSDWPPAGARLEAHAARGTGSLGKARRKALFESFVAWALIRTGITLGGFDARRYRREVGQNADFRKLDDGLKMTIDCDAQTEAQLCALLDQAQADGIVRYGLSSQSEAMMTCIVPSILQDDHVHFIDGAAGGYTQAATRIKEALRAS